MSKRPSLLLTNDDGIDAPGLRILWETLADRYEVTVVAPTHERSGSGMSVSFYQPLHVKEHSWGKRVYSVSGTPTDCVKIAIAKLYSEKPDLVLSGINPGSNAGRNLFYSGTVGGVFEAGLNGIPAAALSCLLEEEGGKPNYSDTLKFIPEIAAALQQHDFPRGTVFNINFPVGTPRGLKMAKQGKSYWRERPIQREHPEGFPYYWLGGVDATFEEEPDSDIALLKAGYVTAVPVSLDRLLCDHSYDYHRESFEEFFNT